MQGPVPADRRALTVLTTRPRAVAAARPHTIAATRPLVSLAGRGIGSNVNTGHGQSNRYPAAEKQCCGKHTACDGASDAEAAT